MIDLGANAYEHRAHRRRADRRFFAKLAVIAVQEPAIPARVRAKSELESIMAQRQGTILKKCQCANQERCHHKWTLRYWADGRQREMSFADELDGQGRPRYGSGKRLAQDAQLKIAHDKRARVFIDPKPGRHGHTNGASDPSVKGYSSQRATTQRNPAKCSERSGRQSSRVVQVESGELSPVTFCGQVTASY